MPNKTPEFRLDPQTVATIVELVAPLAEELIATIIKNTSKLDELIQKVDQLYLRDIKSGFEALGDTLSSHNAETRRVRLEFAERVLLNNTKLQPGTTGGSPNEYLMAQCHYGLCIIALHRDDSELAVRHVLRAFVTDPRSSRKEFFPKVFSRLFDSRCGDIYEWNESELARISREKFDTKVLRNKAAYGDLMALSAAGGIVGAFWGSGVARSAAIKGASQGVKEAYKKLEQVNPEKFRVEARAQQATLLETKIDERCKSTASTALADTGSSQTTRYAS